MFCHTKIATEPEEKSPQKPKFQWSFFLKHDVLGTANIHGQNIVSYVIYF